ncbi:hypothetical protein [Methanoregula sp.]|jgi:hypothetical protein|uniref:hypothetical protein n=1 Tax=Methanoregula sp. TaxID=2052170 RepID=UPI003565FC52
MITWLNGNFKNFKPTAAIALNATRHMNTVERKKLFSPDIEPMRTAEGRWFEAIIYEMFLGISLKSDCIKYIARKGADAPRAGAPACLGQNGIFYSKYGDITFRGNGQDLAEFDLILVDSDDHVAFGEVVTSPADLKEFEIEIAFKKRLLGYLYGQGHVSFLLISSFDISNYSVVKRLAKDPDNAIINTSSCEEIKGLVKHYRPRILYTKPTNHPKLIRATDIPIKHPIDYREYHDEFRNRIFSEITHGRGRKNVTPATDTEALVKKILYGALYPHAIKAVCDQYGLVVKGKRIEYNEFFTYFSKAILATDLPGYELIIYLRSRQKTEYLKMVQTKAGNFRFERPTPSRVGFFLWIESLQPTLGTRISLEILKTFSITDPVKK